MSNYAHVPYLPGAIPYNVIRKYQEIGLLLRHSYGLLVT